MIQEAGQITHFSPGRIRIKMAQLKRNGSQAQQIEQALATVDGVHQVSVNPTTGSVLLLYNPDEVASTEELLEMAKTLGFVPKELTQEQWQVLVTSGIQPMNGDASNREHASSTVSDDIKSLFQRANTQVDEASAGKADLKDLFPLTLALLGVGRLLTADRLLLPVWYDFFWYAFSAFMIFDSSKSNQEKPVKSG